MTTEYETLTFNNLGKYSKFETVASMDEVIYEYIEVLRNDEHPESVIDVLRFFGRSSLRITGVSFAKYQTIIDSVGKSRSTVIRAINTLVSYGMIERIPTVKNWLGRGKSRRKSVNIIAIQSSMTHQDDTTTEDVQANEDKAEENGIESQSSFFKHNSTTRTRNGEDKRGLRAGISTEIYEAISPYFDTSDLYDTYGILLRSKASIDRTIRLEDFASEYIDVFYNVIRKYKLGQVRNFNGLLYSAWKRVTSEISRRIKLGASDGVYFDWLSE